jgi:stage V sporulation protein R
MRTQIMNEGWAMYWEKAIMLELFREGTVKGMIEYAKSVSGVCYPRPFYQRNPYSLGFHMWNHIEQLYRDGKVTLEYVEETDMQRKVNWKKPSGDDPREAMRHLVKTVTDYEFLRRFLSNEVIWATYLNRIPKPHIRQLGLDAKDIVKEDAHYVYIEPEPVKEEMLNFFTHFHRPRIYVIDNDFMDGGLLLFHRDDNRPLRQDWINPTLRNLNLIWKAPVALLSRDTLYAYSANSYKETKTAVPSFETVLERMQNSEKPFRL